MTIRQSEHFDLFLINLSLNVEQNRQTRIYFTHMYFNCSQHAMFTICIFFSILTSKRLGICEGTPKQSPDHKHSTAAGPRPPVLKFLDPLYIDI